ncbi:hypothetical protein J6590_106937 [Homalodisca vitripennis]|nr:hypothetical protein J6590_106937 [Homalodisca vitripennis]
MVDRSTFRVEDSIENEIAEMDTEKNRREENIRILRPCLSDDWWKEKSVGVRVRKDDDMMKMLMKFSRVLFQDDKDIEWDPLRTSNVVIARKERKESERVRRRMKVVVDPRNMTKVKNGIVTPEDSKEEASEIIANEKILLIMIYDVEIELKDEKIVPEIYERNMKEEISEEELKDGFKSSSSSRSSVGPVGSGAYGGDKRCGKFSGQERSRQIEESLDKRLETY